MDLAFDRRPLISGVAATCTLLAAAFFSAGCQRTVSPPPMVLESTQSDEDHLGDAIKNLALLTEQMRPVGYKQVEFHLDEWLRQQDPPADWKRDPLAERIPKEFQGLVSLPLLELNEFIPPDIEYLDQAWTLKQGAKAIVAAASSDRDFDTWMETARAKIGNNAADDLIAAHHLFDWTIRNLQLDPLPRAAAAGPAAPGGTMGKPQASPGVAHPPLEAMLFGHGDAWERARTFSGLCRQHGLLAAVIGFQEESSGAVRPWTVGVLIEKQLYLFDLSLGMPIPGEKGQGIATLDEVRAKPELLQQLDLENEPYPIKAGDLSGAVALMDIDPRSLSRRMEQLEKKLTGAKRMALTSSPTAITQELRQIKSLADVRMWLVPFEALLYRERLQANREWVAEVEREWLPYLGLPLGFARRLHIAGRLDDTDRVGARRIYMESRPTESNTPDLDRQDRQDEILAPFAGRDKERLKNPEWRKATLDLLREQVTGMKMQTSFWLGLAAFDAGQYSAAINHLELRVLAKIPGSKRESGAVYNLARAYEALGQLENARKVYVQDQGPQRIGSLLRAKRLEGKADIKP